MDLPKEHKGVKLRKFRLSDAQEMARLLNNKKISKNMAKIPWPYSRKDAQDRIKRILNNYRQKESNTYQIAVEVDGKLTGNINISKIIRGHRASIGYWLGEEYWNRGIMSIAIGMATKLAVASYRLRRIYAYVFTFNEASRRVLEKNAYVYEGTSKKMIKKGGRYYDCYLLARVR